MLVELAIGDAYGAGFEYAPNRLIREKNDLSSYVQHPRHGIQPGCYTDDTQMTIAIAELMVSGRDWNHENLAERFVAAFKRDPRKGYASRFYDFLVEIQDANDFLTRIRPSSDKSGAAMRAAPIGLLPDVEQVISYATEQARITHDTPGGVNSAVASALSTHYFYRQIGPKKDLPVFLSRFSNEEWTTPWKGKVGALGIMSTRAAVTAIVESASLSEILKRSVAYTGDVDTVATIALGAASHSPEIAQDLPQCLYDGLENGEYGINFLRALDSKLMAIHSTSAS